MAVSDKWLLSYVLTSHLSDSCHVLRAVGITSTILRPHNTVKIGTRLLEVLAAPTLAAEELTRLINRMCNMFALGLTR